MRLLASLLLLTACDGPPAPADGGSQPDAGTDAGAPDAFVRPPDVCDELGLPRAAMLAGGGSAFDDVAGDFAVETLDGPWRLSEHWTGCESYVFLNYAPTPYGNNLFATYPDVLFLNGPRNVHYFFTSYDEDPTAIRDRMTALRDGIEEGFGIYDVPEDDRAFWRARLHFVVEPLIEVEGSAGDLARDAPVVHHAFAITREQRFDPVGSLFLIRGGGFTPDFAMAAYPAHFYNYLAALRARLDAAASAVTVVPLLDETELTARVLDRTITLPDAATMAGFDTLEVDFEEHCRLDPMGCSEWDRIAYVHVCEDASCASTRELVRWITPYSRPGRFRWVMDGSPLLGLVRAGGAQTFRITLGPEWERATARDVRISLRLSRRSTSEPLAATAELAFVGGDFGAAYNTRTPFRFTPPAGSARVELVVIVSGHGQTDGDNCAEWCNHEHTFTVNGAGTHRIDFPGDAGRALGCAERVGEGVVPGQWGNWAPSRAGWCPGLPVEARRFDLTSEVALGAENELAYRGSFAGGEPRGGSIELSAFVVTYR